MGAIRGILLAFVSSLFFISVFLAGATFMLSSSLQYENVKTEITPIAKDIIAEQVNLEQEFNQLYPLMEIYCQNNSEYVFNYEEYTFEIPCETILQGYDAVFNYGIESLVKDVYYKEYNCNFFDCFNNQELPLFLISEKARSFWNSKFYFLLLASIILAGLMFLLVEKKANMPIIAGALIIVASLPFMKIGDILASVEGEFSMFANMFFKTSFPIFIKMLVLGGVILVIGIIIKIFKLGFKISNFFSKFKKKTKAKTEVKTKKKDTKKTNKKIPKEEISKPKSKPQPNKKGK